MAFYSRFVWGSFHAVPICTFAPFFSHTHSGLRLHFSNIFPSTCASQNHPPALLTMLQELEYAVLYIYLLFFAADAPTTLADVSIKTLQTTRMVKEGLELLDPGMAGLLLYPVTCALIAMETLPMAPFAGLFCGHLRGEASMESILSAEMRASLRRSTSPGDSILGSLISDSNQSGPSCGGSAKSKPSGNTYIPPESRK